MSDAVVRLRVEGVVFEAEKETLLRFENTYFHGLFSSGGWQPDADGAYFIDRPAMGFDRILGYLGSGELSVDGLSEEEEECVYSSLDYLLIPYRRVWKYTTRRMLKGFKARQSICELSDGRLCGARGSDVVVWRMHTSVTQMTLNGHAAAINRVIQLRDGRLCTCSIDTTIKLWSIDSGLCELTLTGHTSEVKCVVQLLDGRICSHSDDWTIRVWNILTGACEMLINFPVYSVSQLADGRICCGGYGGFISIYSLLAGECELSWKGHTGEVNAIVCIDDSRICSAACYDDSDAIKVWNTATRECVRTLEGHTDSVTSMVLMHDGRLCSGSKDCTVRLWNLETGECAGIQGNDRSRNYHNLVIQLKDGRLVGFMKGISMTPVCMWS